MTETAQAATGGLQGLGGIATGFMGANAADRASSTIAGGYQGGAQMRYEGAEKALDRSQEFLDWTDQLLEPYVNKASNATNMQSNFLGINGPEAQQQAYDNYLESPGQRWQREQIMNSVLANASATGNLGSANVLTGLQDRAAGLAAQNFQTDYTNLANFGQQMRPFIPMQAGSRGDSVNAMNNLNLYQGDVLASGHEGASGAQAQGILGKNAGYSSALSSGMYALGKSGETGAAAGEDFIRIAPMAMSAFASSVKFKDNIEEYSSDQEKENIDQVLNAKVKKWKYKQETGLDQLPKVGVMLEDVKNAESEYIPDHIDLYKYVMMLTQTVQHLAKQLESKDA